MKKQNLKLITVISYVLLFAFCLLPLTALAALQTPSNVEGALSVLPGDLSPENRIATIINWLLGLAATVAVALIVFSGIRYIISAGSESEVSEAKRTITYAIVGLIVTILAIVFVNVVRRIIGD